MSLRAWRVCRHCWRPHHLMNGVLQDIRLFPICRRCWHRATNEMYEGWVIKADLARAVERARRTREASELWRQGRCGAYDFVAAGAWLGWQMERAEQ